MQWHIGLQTQDASIALGTVDVSSWEEAVTIARVKGAAHLREVGSVTPVFHYCAIASKVPTDTLHDRRTRLLEARRRYGVRQVNQPILQEALVKMQTPLEIFTIRLAVPVDYHVTYKTRDTLTRRFVQGKEPPVARVIHFLRDSYYAADTCDDLDQLLVAQAADILPRVRVTTLNAHGSPGAIRYELIQVAEV